MNDVEELNEKLKRFDSSEKFKKFVLMTFKKDKSKSEKKKYEKQLKEYDPPGHQCSKEFFEVKKCFIKWELLTMIKDEETGKERCVLTAKGRKALKWRSVAPQKPDWLTEKNKFLITTIIAFVALMLSIVSFIRTL